MDREKSTILCVPKWQQVSTIALIPYKNNENIHFLILKLLVFGERFL